MVDDAGCAWGSGPHNIHMCASGSGPHGMHMCALGSGGMGSMHQGGVLVFDACVSDPNALCVRCPAVQTAALKMQSIPP